MGEITFDIKIHHGGIFKCDLRMRYTSGTVNVLSNVNSDFFGWFDLEDVVRKLAYSGGYKNL